MHEGCGWRAWRGGALLITCILYVVVVVSREGSSLFCIAGIWQILWRSDGVAVNAIVVVACRWLAAGSPRGVLWMTAVN